ncbi:MAG TPA: sugar phosphate isomerase/epimerase [Tepidisphaeraceae bacterium]|nr:sugar phosphate isomerase/epimerase [Tepidisphaeraceae bacterium]
MIRLAFSTNAFKKNTIGQAVDAIADVGYRGVEVMADVPHALPATFDAAARRELKKRIADHGQVVSNVNAFTLFACGDTYHPTWIEHELGKRQARIDHTNRAIELAADLGAATVSLQPGGPLIGTGLSPEEAGKRFADGIAACVDTATKCRVTLGIEPEPGLFIQTASEYLAFKRAYFDREPAVMMNCDCGHLFCVGEDPADVIRAMPGHIAHVHLEDIGKNRVHQHLTPGKGVMDFPSIFKALEEMRYGGWTTVELYPYETTAAGVAKAAWDHLTPMLKA